MLRSYVLLVFSGLVALACACPARASTLDPEQDALQSMEQARQELQRGQLDRAELLLERVLMLQPENAEARVELALLMARRGQMETARALLQGLADDLRTPAEHRARLERLLDGLASLGQATAGSAGPANPRVASGASAPAGPQSRPLWRVETSLSWSSNPLARTALSDITFTTPDGPVQVPLTSRPRQGVLAGVGWARLAGAGGVELQLQEAGVSGAQTAVRLNAWGGLPEALNPLSYMLSEIGGPATARLGHTWQWNVQAQQGLDGARRAMAGLSLLSGRWRWTVQRYEEPTLADRGSVLRADAQWPARPGLLWGAHAERSASSTRSQGTWRLGGQAQWVPAGGWRAQLLWQAQQDLQGYSPLLANGAPRRLQTWQGSLERTLNLGSEKTLSARLLATQRRSNIELFDFKELAFQLHLAGLWR